MNRTGSPFPGTSGWAVAGLLLVILHLPCGAAAQDAVENRSKVEAAFLRNFARYVSWPAHSFSNDQSPWMVCVLGGDHFDGSLESTLRGRVEQGRSFEVVRAAALEALPTCQILFIGFQSAARRRSVLDRLKNQPVLTVGNSQEFLSEGGVIRLLPGERIEMSINLDQARSASLGIPAKMLEVSRDVVENGTVRRLR